MRQTPAKYLLISSQEAVKPRVRDNFFLFHQRCTHRRNDSQRDDKRCGQRIGNRQAHIRKQLLGDALREHDRQEYTHSRQRRGENRTAHLRCTLHGSLCRRNAEIAQAIDIFNDDNGVIHKHADAERQAGQRDNVQRHVAEVHEHNRKQHAERNAERDDNRRANVAQKDNQHEHGEQTAIYQIGQHAADNQMNIVALIHQRCDVQLAVILLKFINFLTDGIRNFRSRCRGLLGKAEHNRIIAVYLGIRAIGVLICILHLCHIGQMNVSNVAGIHVKQHHIGQIVDRIILFSDLEDVRIVAAVRDIARRHLKIFCN